jgi:GT2 family glycosyltransferase
LEKNGGYANATNIGVGLSHGEYLMFAEADDFNDPRQIELLLSCITKDEHIGVVFSKSNIVDANGKIIGDDFQFRESSFKKLCSKNSRIERSAMQKFLLSACVIPNMSAALIRRQYFDIIHGFSTLYKMVADWDFWCRMAQACDFYYVAEPLNNFRSHRNTLRNSIKARKQVYEIFDILYRTISEMRLTPFEQIRYKSNIGFIWAYYLTSDFTLENFFQTWRDNKAHDIFGIIYLVWGFVKSALLVARNYIKKLQQIIK